MNRLAATLVAAALLASCTPSSAVKLLAGGGPNVAANVQAGRANVQSVGTSEVSEQRVTGTTAQKVEQSTGDSRVKADRVETVVVNETPVWLVIALAVALFLDSPLRWPGQIVDGIRRARGRKPF